MKHELIKTENYLLVVDDSEIKEGDYILTPYQKSVKATKTHTTEFTGTCTALNDCKKIISHYPLKGSPILEGVDLLPELPSEVEVLASEYVSRLTYPNERKCGFLVGYSRASEKYKYTEEDLKYALIVGTQYSEQDGLSIVEKFEKLKSLLSQQKLPIAFEQEILNNEEWHNAPAAILNSSGQIVWVGEYIFND